MSGSQALAYGAEFQQDNSGPGWEAKALESPGKGRGGLGASDQGVKHDSCKRRPFQVHSRKWRVRVLSSPW